MIGWIGKSWDYDRKAETDGVMKVMALTLICGDIT